MYTADTLSRAPIPTEVDLEISSLEQLTQMAMDACIAELPASPTTLSDLEQAQNEDPVLVLAMVIKYCKNGWPKKTKLNEVILPYWETRAQLMLNGNLLLYARQIVVPASRQREILGKLHTGHQGIRRCRLRAKLSLWWPGLPSKLDKYIHNCPDCTRERCQPKEPLLPTPLPRYPWQKVATDLFQIRNTSYLILVDYFS